jgi:hypothetical protein
MPPSRAVSRRRAAAGPSTSSAFDRGRPAARRRRGTIAGAAAEQIERAIDVGRALHVEPDETCRRLGVAHQLLQVLPASSTSMSSPRCVGLTATCAFKPPACTASITVSVSARRRPGVVDLGHVLPEMREDGPDPSCSCAAAAAERVLEPLRRHERRHERRRTRSSWHGHGATRWWTLPAASCGRETRGEDTPHARDVNRFAAAGVVVWRCSRTTSSGFGCSLNTPG